MTTFKEILQEAYKLKFIVLEKPLTIIGKKGKSIDLPKNTKGRVYSDYNSNVRIDVGFEDPEDELKSIFNQVVTFTKRNDDWFYRNPETENTEKVELKWI